MILALERFGLPRRTTRERASEVNFQAPEEDLSLNSKGRRGEVGRVANYLKSSSCVDTQAVEA